MGRDDHTTLIVWRIIASAGALCLPPVLWLLSQINGIKEAQITNSERISTMQSNMPREISNAIQQSELVRVHEELRRAREELSAARTAAEKPPSGKGGPKL